MKHIRLLTIPAAAFMLLIAGCYTQLYKPGMEQASRQQETLYNRYDSTAIDTTLREDTTQYYGAYPDPGWYYWGRARHYPMWGTDYDYYTPDYYWGYSGYDNYYGTPWWYGYGGYGRGYGGGGYGGSPSEPPSKRGGHRSHDNGGSGSYAAPPAAPGGSPSYANPPSQPSTPPPSSGSTDDGKRAGRRGH